jgi:uncharacterized membrane protein
MSGGGEGGGRDEGGRAPDATASATALEIVRGHFVPGREVTALRPCGAEAWLWVVDRTGRLRDLHRELAPRGQPGAEIFVAVAGHVGPPPEEGPGADHAGTLRVEEVVYAAFEGFGCGFDWRRFHHRAQGNEPFWTLEVLPEGMRLTRPGQPDLIWNDVVESRESGTVTYRGRGDPQPVELIIEPGASRDTMSGAYYGLSARLDLDGQILTGHALPGTAPREP